jgi:hypothetical protein
MLNVMVSASAAILRVALDNTQDYMKIQAAIMLRAMGIPSWSILAGIMKTSHSMGKISLWQAWNLLQVIRPISGLRS